MKIRPVHRQDRDEWHRMRLALYGAPNISELDEWFDSPDSAGTHAVGLAVIVADRGDGNLAGFAEIGARNYAEGCASTPVAYLEGWWVDADVRRTGLGARLVAAAEAWALANDFEEMASDTELNNAVSLQAHLAIGFEEVERHICFRKRLR